MSDLIRLRVRHSFSLAGETCAHEPGEVLEADPRMARILLGMGVVDQLPALPPEPPPPPSPIIIPAGARTAGAAR